MFCNEKWYCSDNCEPKFEEIYQEWKKKNPIKLTTTKNNKKITHNESFSHANIDLGLEDYEEKNKFIKNFDEYYK